MENTQIVIIVAIIIFFLLKKLSQVSPQKARELRAGGALVIDVRTSAEFAAGHIADAINIPLDQLSEMIEKQVPDKQRALLVYCLSGTRSGMARRVLQSKQYKDSYNLGSIYRARSILT